MKEHTRSMAPAHGGDEPWPTMEARWPNAIWMSPWAFGDDEGDDRSDEAAPSRH
jgi:hypothetical protein